MNMAKSPETTVCPVVPVEPMRLEICGFHVNPSQENKKKYLECTNNIVPFRGAVNSFWTEYVRFGVFFVFVPFFGCFIDQ